MSDLKISDATMDEMVRVARDGAPLHINDYNMRGALWALLRSGLVVPQEVLAKSISAFTNLYEAHAKLAIKHDSLIVGSNKNESADRTLPRASSPPAEIGRALTGTTTEAVCGLGAKTPSPEIGSVVTDEDWKAAREAYWAAEDGSASGAERGWRAALAADRARVSS